MGHSYRTLLWDTLKGHSCETLLWDTVAGHPCGTILWDTLVGHSCRDTVCPHTRSSHASVSHETSLSSLQNERFVRDFLQKSRVNSPKRAFRTRLPQKLTRQSLRNERFVRDFLQKSSGNTHRSTHITQPCQAVSRFQPSKQHPLTRQTL